MGMGVIKCFLSCANAFWPRGKECNGLRINEYQYGYDGGFHTPFYAQVSSSQRPSVTPPVPRMQRCPLLASIPATFTFSCDPRRREPPPPRPCSHRPRACCREEEPSALRS